MSAVGKPLLYSYWRSSCAWRVRIALNLKEIQYDIKPINLVKDGGEQNSEEFKKINPMGRVPALHIDGHTLIESMNIINYLEETRPERALMPNDVLKRSKVREICDIIVTGIQPLQNWTLLCELEEDKRNEWAQRWIDKGFEAVEKLLTLSSGKYCVGNEITVADCCLIPQIYNARRYKVNLQLYPLILKIEKELEIIPAFQAAHPLNQPDCPEEAKK
ncbi:unnamed protein product [Nezara viridula]|uniref:Maleylacetoacetate isomerase n=1 Tax=Nezara viridula TaxID=85310 RepID=A0A9P0EA34_NEZVI|nr:unnamed protein product [Nezara viridula]